MSLDHIFMGSHLDMYQIGEIISVLRKQRGVSQEQLACALGIPRSAVSQMENGGRELSFIEFQKFLDIFKISLDEFLAHGGTSAKVKFEKQKSVNKKIKFDPERFKQLLLYILGKCGSRPNVGETVLYKLLYFCDFDFFELYEKPLTGMKYKRMQFGPVPDQTLFTPVLKEMRQSGVLEKVSRTYVNDTIQTRYLNFVESDLSVFGTDLNKMLKVVDSVVDRLSGMSARQIEDHSHRDYPWLSHQDNEEIDYASVFSRTGEFANRDYDAMWLQASANDVLAELGEMSREEHDYYMSLPD